MKREKFGNSDFENLEEANSAVSNYYELYKYNVTQVIESFKNLSIIVDGSAGNPVEKLAKLIKIKLNNGCKKPLKILFNSANSSNAIQMKQKLVMIFGIVSIDLHKLVFSHISNKTPKGQMIVEAKTSNMDIPKEVLVDIILERIEKIDCRVNGFVLDLNDYDFGVLDQCSDKNLSFHLLLNLKNERKVDKIDSLKKQIKFEKVFEFEADECAEDFAHKIYFEVSHFYD